MEGFVELVQRSFVDIDAPVLVRFPGCYGATSPQSLSLVKTNNGRGVAHQASALINLSLGSEPVNLWTLIARVFLLYLFFTCTKVTHRWRPVRVERVSRDSGRVVLALLGNDLGCGTKFFVPPDTAS